MSDAPSADEPDHAYRPSDPMTPADVAVVASLLETAGVQMPPTEFKRVASARSLYHWNSDAGQEY